MYCDNCGAKLANEAKFCEECGHKILEEKEASSNFQDALISIPIGDKKWFKEHGHHHHHHHHHSSSDSKTSNSSKK